MTNVYDIIKNPLQTEKGTRQLEQNQYLFQVGKNANKIEIKRAVEEIYKVKVAKVRSCIMPSKPKRLRQQLGLTSEWKKAIVTLKAGSKIELS